MIATFSSLIYCWALLEMEYIYAAERKAENRILIQKLVSEGNQRDWESINAIINAKIEQNINITTTDGITEPETEDRLATLFK